jgi:hypothetical protein
MDFFGFQSGNKSAFYLVVHDLNYGNAKIYKGLVTTVNTPPTVIYTEPTTTVRLSYLLVSSGYQFAGFGDGAIKITEDEWATHTNIVAPDASMVLCIRFDEGLSYLYITTANGIWYAPIDLVNTAWTWIKEPTEIGEGLYSGHLIDRDNRTGIISGAYETIYARFY